MSRASKSTENIRGLSPVVPVVPYVSGYLLRRIVEDWPLTEINPTL